MMGYMTRANKCQSGHADVIIIGRTGLLQLIIIERIQEQFIGAAQRFEFFYQVIPFAFGCFGCNGPVVLIKTG
jgi:hypothetical protein